MREWIYTASSQDALGKTSLLSAVYGYSIDILVFSSSQVSLMLVQDRLKLALTGKFIVAHLQQRGQD